MADIFDVLADGTRRELLSTLRSRRDDPSGQHPGEMSVGELVVAMGLSQPTVSKHLRVLRDGSLVAVREQGQHRFYRLAHDPLVAVDEWLRPFLPAPAPAAPAPATASLPPVEAVPGAGGAAPLRPFTRVLAERLGSTAGRVALAVARARDVRRGR